MEKDSRPDWSALSENMGLDWSVRLMTTRAASTVSHAASVTWFQPSWTSRLLFPFSTQMMRFLTAQHSHTLRLCAVIFHDMLKVNSILAVSWTSLGFFCVCVCFSDAQNLYSIKHWIKTWRPSVKKLTGGKENSSSSVNTDVHVSAGGLLRPVFTIIVRQQPREQQSPNRDGAEMDGPDRTFIPGRRREHASDLKRHQKSSSLNLYIINVRRLTQMMILSWTYPRGFGVQTTR